MKNLLPFLLSGVLSVSAMLTMMFSYTLKFPNLKYGPWPILIPGLLFILAYWIRFLQRLNRKFWITSLLLMVCWIICFGLSFNAGYIFLIAFSSVLGAIVVVLLGSKRHSINVNLSYWKIALICVFASYLGLGFWVLLRDGLELRWMYNRSNIITSLNVPIAFIIGFWQIAMGFILDKVEDTNMLEERLQEIGSPS